MDFRFNEYAKVLILKGVNIQVGQKLVIRCPIEAAFFAEMCAKVAYEQGAREVEVLWNDEKLTLLNYQYMSQENLSKVSKTLQTQYEEYRQDNIALLSLVGQDPSLLKEIDANKIKGASTARSIALKNFNEDMMSDQHQWCVAGVAVKSWATHLFPELSHDQALEKLWEQIFSTSRIDDHTLENWENHLNRLNALADKLNRYQFDSLIYKNSLGTDLTIGLPENHIWAAADSKTPKDIPFVPNIPTEEVFTLPHRDRVDGVVYSTKPFNYGGNIIRDFKLRFEGGKVVEFDAKEGRDILAKLIDTDEGSKRLGEVALVPYDSPISNTNLLFYNTLYDENASCHLAIGKAYPTCLEGFENLSSQDLLERGANDSLVHEDFMVGSKDLSIIGLTKDGKRIQIFENGNFAKEF